MTALQFVRCRDCEELFRPSPLDRAPEYYLTDDGPIAEVRDDCMAFLTRHARHKLETLRPTATPAAHDGAVADPMARTVWEVSNGEDVVLVQSWRESMREPLRYRVIPGRLVAEPPSVEICEDDVRSDIDRALYPGIAPHRKLDAFVARFKAVAWSLDPATLEIVYDHPGDPTLSVAQLPASALAQLAASASEIFDEDDATRIAASLGASADDPDTFTVLLRQRVRVE
ncbi:MAG: hypothetical protein E6J72_10925 [Deltaproteobacteria bacterium]|nr:MAG: hypothetical protein E6J72_10925 [Deltaproteobacteria bacterium]